MHPLPGTIKFPMVSLFQKIKYPLHIIKIHFSPEFHKYIFFFYLKDEEELPRRNSNQLLQELKFLSAFNFD